MGLVGRLFLPLIAALAAAAIWLVAEFERDTVFPLSPVADGPSLLSPGAGPPGDRAAARPEGERPARERFARPFTHDSTRANIAVVVTGLGLAADATLRAIEQLPPEVTLAFSPYGENLAQHIDRARARGHEILLAVPMEPSDPRRRDAGPAALTMMLSEDAARRRLAAMLDRVHGHVGIIGDFGDRFARDPVAMRPVLDELAARGLLYVANRLEGTEPMIAGADVAMSGLPAAKVSVWLDRELSGEGIDREIADAEAQAKRRGSVVVLAQPYPFTIARIAAWMQTFERKALLAAPVSAVARAP